MKKIVNYKIIFIGIGVLVVAVGIAFGYMYDRKDTENFNVISSISENEEKTNQIEKDVVADEFIYVHIDGEVHNPGVYKLNHGSRVIDVIEVAGGITENANMKKVNLAYFLNDGQKIYIQNKNIDEDENTTDIFDSIYGDNLKININTATQSELESINGVGPALASKIIDYRKKNGRFKSIEDIKKVPGVGNAKYENMINEICI